MCIRDRYEVSTDLIELNRHFVLIIDSICTELEREYGIVFTRSNKYQFTLLLMTRAVRNQDVSLPSRATLSIHPSTMRLVDSIVQAVKQVYDIDLTDIDFFLSLIHICNSSAIAHIARCSSSRSCSFFVSIIWVAPPHLV